MRFLLSDIDYLANELIQKIKHYLITNMGKVENEASTEEFYFALCMALRERIMINWTTTLHSHDDTQAKTIYYLSMEYLPGKLLGSITTNIEAHEILAIALKKLNRNFADILACDPEPGLGNGGLGRLASCFLDSLSTLKYPAWAYGLRYHYGIFEQEIWNGFQVERPDCWLLNENPWELRKDGHAKNIHFGGKLISGTNRHGDEVFDLEDYEEVRALPYDMPMVGYPDDGKFCVSTLRLWSTKESPRNFQLQRYNSGQVGEAKENTSLTDVLYPNDNHELGKRIRLKQEFLLVSASLQDIIQHQLRINGDVKNLPDKAQIQINDTHPALIIAELTRTLIKDHDLTWDQAWEVTQKTCNYTNHTVLKESLEEWNEQRVNDLLPRQYRMIQKLNQRFCDKVRKAYPHNEEKIKRMSLIENGQIRMAHLAIIGSNKVNGVAELHTELLKHQLFKDFFELYPEKFIPITNGISQRRWLLHCNPNLSDLITKLIGNKWISHFPEIENLAKFANDKNVQEEFWKIKNKNKENLYDYLSKYNAIRDHKGKIIDHSPIFDTTDVLIDLHIKRLHEYKRQLLNALHTIILYQEIKKDPNSHKIKRYVIVAGKAAPGYEVAKQVITLFCCLARTINEDPIVSKQLKICFVENYNVSKAEILIPAADLSQQISTAGKEASGTGNMKLALNGALTIATRDGSNIEMENSITEKWWPFAFGASVEEIENLKKDNQYIAFDYYSNNPLIKNAVDVLKDGTLVKNEDEHKALLNLYNSLLECSYHGFADPYFVIKDLPSYYETQKKVEELFLDKNKWAEYAIHNIAGMKRFSSDSVINNYVKSIWNIDTCPLNPFILEKVKQEFEEHTLSYVRKENLSS